MEGQGEREREKEGGGAIRNSLTLAGRDVAVSPVDPVLVIGNVAPRLHVPVGIPAEMERSREKRWGGGDESEKEREGREM